MTAGSSYRPANPTVLAVDDLDEYLQLYEAQLGDEYRVRTVSKAADALDLIDETIDVVLLDRNMPDMSGDEVLERIRDAGHDCRVALVTAVEPDRDVVDMGFDASLVKPVSRDRLRDTVERLLRRTRYDDELTALYDLCAKRASHTDRGETDVEAYNDLVAEIGERRRAVDAAAAEFTPDDYRAAFRDIPDF
ncbi:hoxA-like transcriptional regulator [Halarchaeum acidiphilum MH1-52-1]|uniref:HoxA-like transcriptional regulator n=1 Tax=Halarchaeum acidiphilum MH1-52-1 TaxID=1261545 RepID=U2YGU7_9EURY|nr:response regulator [Halarchaeum acidiphilum]GAD53596.1 hoxA-like transcriptional regulator [Halarchaeum acidiphilum MH1-52-1]